MMNYILVRHVHIVCAIVSITLFVVRGVMQTAGCPWRRWGWLRIAPHLIDTLLLGAAITLAWQSHQYPIAQTWLTAKVVALLLYIGLGTMALRRGVSGVLQFISFLAALAAVSYIVGVAVTRSATLGLM